ncbi:MAG: hypothetical protein PVH61_31380 [Candidatus Aminicenantes bacterium]|jgi:hypothetical protein
MTFLKADKFLHAKRIYEVSFDEILKHIIRSYKSLIHDNIQLKNDENKIRDILVEHYLNHPLKRQELLIDNLIFNREPSENMARGFVDIKIQTMISLNNPKAYYIFECKRLDGRMDLNRKYIKDGIMRFVSEKYSSYYALNGMLGFEVKKLNTTVNIEAINKLAAADYPEINIIKKLTSTVLSRDFSYSYISRHNTISLREIKLYHLMLDFSGVIRNE